MIHPGLGGHHPRKQDDGHFVPVFFVEAKFLKYHPAIILGAMASEVAWYPGVILGARCWKQI